MAVLSPTQIEINQRVIECFKSLGYENKKAGKSLFAKELNIDKANLSKYFALDRPFPTEVLVNLTKEKNINGHWLLTGEGNMFNEVAEQRVTFGNSQSTYSLTDDEVRSAKNESDLIKLVAKKYLNSMPFSKLTIKLVLDEEVNAESIRESFLKKFNILKDSPPS